MRKKHKVKGILKRILFVAVLFLLLPLGIEDYKAISEEDVQRAEQELQAAKDREAEIERQLDELSGSITSTQNYITEVDAIISNLSLQIYQSEQAIAAKQQEIDDKQAQIDLTLAGIAYVQADIEQKQAELADAQETEAEQYASMKLRIQYMYENGDDTFMEVLFSSDSMIDFLNNAEYISEISKYDRQKLVEYGETKDYIATLLGQLEGQETELLVQQNKYETELAELEAEQNTLVVMKEALEVDMATYDAVYQQKNAELTNLENQQSYTEQQRLDAEREVEEQTARVEQARKDYADWLAEMARLNQDAEAAIQAKLAEINITGFTWPLPGYNTITSQFGMRMHPILGYEKLHDGTDISGYEVNGKPIVAAYSGTVVLSEYYWGYGNCVKIDHGGGIQTLYAHASVLLVSVGQHVNAGDTIALVGSSGNSTGPHLHFSLIIAGEFVNPLDYVSVPRY